MRIYAVSHSYTVACYITKTDDGHTESVKLYFIYIIIIIVWIINCLYL